MFRKFNNGLLGYAQNSTTRYFSGSDNEERYFQNLRTKPKDWYYRDRKLTYVYNSNGHRCHEIDKIDFNNYVLFAGDSHVEGIGLELETTFSYIVSKKLNTSYYNLGLGATGADVMLYNVLTWISKYPKPKYVFMYWSDPARFVKFFEVPEAIHPVLVRQNLPFDDEKMLVHGEINGYFKSKIWLACSLLSNVLDNSNIPFFNFYLGTNEMHYNSRLIKPILPNCERDYARDDHFGIKMQNAISDVLCEQFNNKYMNATINSITRG